MAKIFFVVASCSAFLAVGLGAFGAHLLKEKLTPELLAIFEVAVRYHMYHAIGLFVVALGMTQFPGANLEISGWLFVGGTIIFSGSLYVLSMTNTRWLGAITPLGGLCFLAGWLWMVWTTWKSL